MKKIYVKYYDPSEVMEGTIGTLSKSDVLYHCFRVAQYSTEAAALWAYANTTCTWSTLLDEDANVKGFIDMAYEAIKNNNYEWLEKYFV